MILNLFPGQGLHAAWDLHPVILSLASLSRPYRDAAFLLLKVTALRLRLVRCYSSSHLYEVIDRIPLNLILDTLDEGGIPVRRTGRPWAVVEKTL